ncbi:Notchless protein-like 1, partial [Ophiophagus hannah]
MTIKLTLPYQAYSVSLTTTPCCLPNEEPVPLAFYVQESEIVACLQKTLAELALETERVIEIIYQPQAVFRVRAVTRCTSSLEGHSEAVISVAFSPTGKEGSYVPLCGHKSRTPGSPQLMTTIEPQISLALHFSALKGASPLPSFASNVCSVKFVPFYDPSCYRVRAFGSVTTFTRQPRSNTQHTET